MSSPWNHKIAKYVTIIKEVQKHFKTYDMHIHPTEVVCNLLNYKEDPELKGLFYFGTNKYTRPCLDELRKDKPSDHIVAFIRQRPQVIPMLLRKTYSHTGPRVFCGYFDLAGIDKGLLLPVAPATGPVEPQMEISYRMFKNDIRFCMAGSVPNTIRNQDIEWFLRNEIEKYKIVAVKIHPNITSINLGNCKGKERVECIIDSSARVGIPVIIHGGRSSFLAKDRGGFSDILNLKDINFESTIPIVLAHGGAYESSYSEVTNDVLPIIKRLVSLYPNLLVDLSALDYQNILLFLSNLETERILFGSDALYENQLMMLMRLLYALEISTLKLEDSLIHILSKNAATKIFKECPNKIS